MYRSCIFCSARLGVNEALEGKLAELKAACCEAEEIAAIADVLPDDPLNRLEKR